MLRKFCHILLIMGVFGQSNKTKIRDEDRPYEFSFRIDSEQHRYEKKDVNGIIQGEFGFITADGVYHVTVYATDENGNFKIISMKNIKVSEPLDQINRISQTQQSGSQHTTPSHNQQSSQYSSSNYQTSASYQQASVTTPKYHPSVSHITRKPFYDFTTASTIRQGCGGCGIITTPLTPIRFFSSTLTNKPYNHKDVVFPNTIKNQQQLQPNALNLYDVAENASPTSQPQIVYTPTGSFNNNNGIFKETTKQTLHTVSEVYLNNEVLTNTGSKPIAPSVDTTFNNPYTKAPQQVTENTIPQTSTLFNHNSKERNTEAKKQLQNHSSIHALNDSAKYILQDQPSKAVVENGVIKVPGNDPIPIQDKYPNMVEGLPNGITKQDISDLLYKFNYTVGFHGHYEKGWRNGTKVGGYFVNGRDGYSRVVTYVADEFGYRPKFKLIRLGLDSLATPKEDTEKSFGLQHFEFVWYPIK